VTDQSASFPERNSLGSELSIFLFSFFFLRIGLCKFEADGTPLTPLITIWPFLCVNCSSEGTSEGIRTATVLSSFISQAARNPLGVLPHQIAIPVSEKLRLFIGAHTETSIVKNRRKILLNNGAGKHSGAYGGPIPFVI
jgi:hypothetical protein